MWGWVWHNGRWEYCSDSKTPLSSLSLSYRCGDRYGTTGDGGTPAAVPSSETPTALMPQVSSFCVSFFGVFCLKKSLGDGGTLAPVLSSEILTALMKQVC